MDTITKKELVERIAARTGQTRVVVKMVVQEFLDQIILDLKRGNRLEFRDFGVFEVRNRKPRTAQNPKTLERLTVPAHRTVKFKIGRLMRESVGRDAPAPAAAQNGEHAPARPARPRAQRVPAPVEVAR